MLLTSKQIELMRVITEANPDGTDIDLDQLIERLRYTTTQDSLQFSIRALIKRELIEKTGMEKRRDRRRILIRATDMGMHYAGPNRKLSITTTVEDDLILEEIGTVGF